MDRGKAIACFLNHFEQLTRLPLITDQEMKDLYGGEVESAIRELDRINREKHICMNCDENCCQRYGCEFFAPQLGWCPVFDMRPVICRIHFCQRFHSAACTTILELYDIFLDSLDIAAKAGSTKVGLFEIPPFAAFAPQLIDVIAPTVKAVKEGNLDPQKGRRQIGLDAMRYRLI